MGEPANTGGLMRHRVKLFIAALCTALPLTAQGAAGAVGTAPPPPRAELSAALRAVTDAGSPGAIAGVRDADGRWRGRSGVADIRRPAPPSPSGQVRIASISKSFVATMVLQLADEGRLGLDDPVARHLPGLLPYPERITIRQLLQHTSGLPRGLPPRDNWTSLPEIDTERFVHFAPEQVVRRSTSQPLLFPPGTSWSYSNTGYTVLALLVERVTGQRLERALSERITGPLRLRGTYLVRGFPFVPGKAGRGYEQLYPAPAGLTDVTVYNFSRVFGSGSMISNTDDLNRFFTALFGGELLRPATLAQMKRTVPALTPDGRYAGFDYGLGLMRLPLDLVCPGAEPGWGHGGDVPGYGSWSMHSASGDRHITTAMTRDITAGDAHASLQALLGTEFCGHRPQQRAAGKLRLESIARTISLGPDMAGS